MIDIYKEFAQVERPGLHTSNSCHFEDYHRHCSSNENAWSCCAVSKVSLVGSMNDLGCRDQANMWPKRPSYAAYRLYDSSEQLSCRWVVADIVRNLTVAAVYYTVFLRRFGRVFGPRGRGHR